MASKSELSGINLMKDVQSLQGKLETFMRGFNIAEEQILQRCQLSPSDPSQNTCGLVGITRRANSKTHLTGKEPAGNISLPFRFSCWL